jgi:hypothetical protein
MGSGLRRRRQDHQNSLKDESMNKLLVALIAGALALGPVFVSAQNLDKTQPQPVDQKALKAEHDAAKAKANAMTPEEKAAAKKAKRAQHQKDLSNAQTTQQEGGATQPARAAETKAETKASKGDPKALSGKDAHQKAATETEKKAGPAQ